MPIPLLSTLAPLVSFDDFWSMKDAIYQENRVATPKLPNKRKRSKFVSIPVKTKKENLTLTPPLESVTLCADPFLPAFSPVSPAADPPILPNLSPPITSTTTEELFALLDEISVESLYNTLQNEPLNLTLSLDEKTALLKINNVNASPRPSGLKPTSKGPTPKGKNIQLLL